MSFLKGLFGRKKEAKRLSTLDEHEIDPVPMRRQQSGRRSIHGDLTAGLPECYRKSAGRRYPKGPLSCPGGPMEDEREPPSFLCERRRTHEHVLEHPYGNVRSRRREERSSDYSSQGDPSPTGQSHMEKSRGGYYAMELDESDDEELKDARIHRKLRFHTQRVLELEEELTLKNKLIRRLEKKERENHAALRDKNHTIQIMTKQLNEKYEENDRLKKQLSRLQMAYSHENTPAGLLPSIGRTPQQAVVTSPFRGFPPFPTTGLDVPSFFPPSTQGTPSISANSTQREANAEEETSFANPRDINTSFEPHFGAFLSPEVLEIARKERKDGTFSSLSLRLDTDMIPPDSPTKRVASQPQLST